MSRIGRLPIPVPKGVSVEVAPGRVKVKGPKGELEVPVSPEMRVVVEEGVVRVEAEEVGQGPDGVLRGQGLGPFQEGP